MKKTIWGKKVLLKARAKYADYDFDSDDSRNALSRSRTFYQSNIFSSLTLKSPASSSRKMYCEPMKWHAVSTSTDINGLRLGPSYLSIKRGDLFLFFSFLLLLSKQTWDNGKEHLREVLKQLCDNVFVWLTRIVNHTMSWSKIFIPGWICHGEQSACHVAYYRRR